MIINKKIKRTMLENKSQYGGSLILIIISCMLYSLFNQLTGNMGTGMSNFEKNYAQEDASFISDRKLTGIADLESRLNMKIEETKTLDSSAGEGKTLRIFSRNEKVNIPAIIEGESLKENGILIDPAFAKANKFDPGDSIKILGRNFRISGYMSLPNYIYPLKSEGDIMNDANSFGIAVISKEDFDSIKPGGSSSYAIRFNDRTGSLEDKIDSFKTYLKDQGIVILKWSNITDNPRVTFLTAKLEGINAVSSSMPIFILMLTCILTGIVIWRMLKRELVSVGTLYSLGYRRREIFKHYLVYPLSVALIGGITGTVLGALTLKPMLDLMVSYFNMPIEDISFNIKYIIASILLPVFFLTVSGYLVINKALDNSPVDLMKGGREKNRVNFIERHMRLERLSFNSKFKVREMLRSIPRSLFLVLGVVLATMLLLMGFVMKSSMDYMVNKTYGDAYRYQYQYSFNSLQQGVPDKGEAFLEVPFSPESNIRKTIAVYGIKPDSIYISLKDKSGEKLTVNKIVATRALSEKFKLKAGDTINLINKLDSKKYSFKIDSIADSYLGEYIYLPLDRLNSILGFPEGSYAGIWSSSAIDIPEDKLLNVSTIDDFRNAFDAMTKPMESYVGIIAVLAFIIGLIVIYVVTSLIIEENKENISLMKVMGYRKKEVYSLILNSSSVLVILGYIIGIPVLLASIGAMLKSATKDISFVFPVTIEYSYIVIGFVLIYLTYEVSKSLSRKKVNRISMVEALKAQRE